MFGVQQQKKDGDPRVASALQELGIKFEVQDNGNYRFGLRLKDGRTQLGFICSDTYEFAGVELRDIFSVGLKSFGPFDARTAGFLLDRNSQLKIGAWCVARDSQDNHLAIFSAKVSADLTGERLLGVIVAVVSTADEIEQRLSGRDDF